MKTNAGRRGAGKLVLALQLVLGLAAFFAFFAAMFNGLDRAMTGAAVIGLAVNLLVSALVSRRSIRAGVAAAAAFGSPALLFSAFSLGDMLAYGKVEPFLFWFSSAVAAIGAGLLGVLVVSWRPPGGKNDRPASRIAR